MQVVWNNVCVCVCVCVGGMPKSSNSEKMIMTKDSMTLFRRDVYQPCLSTGTVFGQDFVYIFFLIYVYGIRIKRVYCSDMTVTPKGILYVEN